MPRRPQAVDWMWAQACDLIEQAERMHGQFFRLAASPRAHAVWEPPVDVFEDERELVVVVALPGVAADRVEVARDGDALVVRAERPAPTRGTQHAVRRLEIPYGSFERRIVLPPGRFEASAPQLVNGCLVLRLTKADWKP